MWLKLNFIALLLISVVSCTNRPKEVLSPSKMEDVIFDLYLVDGAFEQKNIVDAGVDTSLVKMYQGILDKHEISQANFDSSLVWYASQPKQFKRIYEDVILRLEKFKTKESARIDLEDSLAILNEVHHYSIWKNASKYQITNDSVLSRYEFAVTDTNFIKYDEFLLKFKARLGPVDSVSKYSTGVWIYYSDGKRDSLLSALKTDSVEWSYSFHLHARRDAAVDSLKIVLLQTDKSQKEKFKLIINELDLVRRYKLANSKTPNEKN